MIIVIPFTLLLLLVYPYFHMLKKIWVEFTKLEHAIMPCSTLLEYISALSIVYRERKLLLRP